MVGWWPGVQERAVGAGNKLMGSEMGVRVESERKQSKWMGWI